MTKQTPSGSSPASLDLEALTGSLPIRMTSDYLFKFLLQSDIEILKGIICAYLDLDSDEIRDIRVTNAIQLKDDPAKKEMILDIKAEMNDDTVINLEMQVLNNHDWPERSISYLCRCFDNLKSGQGYHRVKGAYHLGFLDYTLFPDAPEFYATYRLRNDRTGQLYTGKFCISVVNLKQINLATAEDRQKHRDLWALFFKARSWEDLKMLAHQDPDIRKAAETVHKLTQDELFRQQYEAREDFIRQQIDHDAWYDGEIRKRDAVIAEKDSALAEKDSQITKQASEITKQASEIEALKKQIAELQKTAK